MESFAAWLKGLRTAGRFRRLPVIDRPAPGRVTEQQGRQLHDFASNDYLALAHDPRLAAAAQAAIERYGTGAGAARLMSGDLPPHRCLEQAAAALVAKERALVFGSGYLANTGIIPALIGRHGVVLTDRLNHASIYDGCRLAGARMLRFRHNDCDHLETLLRQHSGRPALAVVESVYSMDGDFAPLADIVALKKRYGFLLLVDEAHAVGLYGPEGGGRVREMGLSAEVDLVLGTFGKALGSYGAFVAAGPMLIDVLINRARTFIFSTALPPATAAASQAAIEVVRADPSLRSELAGRSQWFKQALSRHGIETSSPSQIVPVVVGRDDAAVAAAQALCQRGFYVTAVRPPTVPPGTARLRFTITLHHTASRLEEAAAALAEALIP